MRGKWDLSREGGRHSREAVGSRTEHVYPAGCLGGALGGWRAQRGAARGAAGLRS